MRKELLLSHRLEKKHDCSTTSLYALLQNLPDQQTIDALFRNTYSLKDLATMVSLEFKRQGILTGFTPIDYHGERRNPSDFFRNYIDRIKHGPYAGDFIGGLMLTKRINNSAHVIAITNIHKGKTPKATIVDTAFHEIKPLIRKVPLEYLDRHIASPDGPGVRAFAIAGIPYNPTIDYHTAQTLEIPTYWEYEMITEQEEWYREKLIEQSNRLNSSSLSEDSRSFE